MKNRPLGGNAAVALPLVAVACLFVMLGRSSSSLAHQPNNNGTAGGPHHARRLRCDVAFKTGSVGTVSFVPVAVKMLNDDDSYGNNIDGGGGEHDDNDSLAAVVVLVGQPQHAEHTSDHTMLMMWRINTGGGRLDRGNNDTHDDNDFRATSASATPLPYMANTATVSIVDFTSGFHTPRNTRGNADEPPTRSAIGTAFQQEPVSYTHLTLPTIYSV